MSKKTLHTNVSEPGNLTHYFRDVQRITKAIIEIIEVTMKHIIVLLITFAWMVCALAPQSIFAKEHIWKAEQPQPSVVRGRVWDDANHDGIRQQSEKGYAGIEVTLYTGRVQVVTTTVTSTTGEYEFTNLEALSYTIGFALPRDYSFTMPRSSQATSSTDSNVNPNGLTDEIAIGAGDEVVNIDAGIWRSALVSDDPPMVQMHFVFLALISNGP